ncbi:MAG: hypothetical protein KF862_06985 [Chitinophagaceae bacterium]|nr:hypothetical protein [Chitinophagaceae bacterium]
MLNSTVNAVLWHESSHAAAGVRKLLLLPYPFHLLDVESPVDVKGAGKEVKEINTNIFSAVKEIKYFPYTPMPPEPQGYIKANKCDHY